MTGSLSANPHRVRIRAETHLSLLLSHCMMLTDGEAWVFGCLEDAGVADDVVGPFTCVHTAPSDEVPLNVSGDFGSELEELLKILWL